MGKWKRECLILHGEEKSEGGLSVKQRRDERERKGRGSDFEKGGWTFRKEKLRKNQRKEIKGS